MRSCLWLNLLHGPFWQTLVSVFERRRLHWISLMSSSVGLRKFLDQINVRTSTCGRLGAGEDKSKGESVTQRGGREPVRAPVRAQPVRSPGRGQSGDQSGSRSQA